MGLDLIVSKRPKNGNSFKKTFKKGVMVKDPRAFVSGMVGDRPRHVEFMEEEEGSEFVIITARIYIPQDIESNNHESVQQGAEIFVEMLEMFQEDQIEDIKGQWLSYLLECIDGKFGEEALQTVKRIVDQRLENGGW